MLAGQAGMKVAGWLKVVWAGMKRYATKGCWPAGAGSRVLAVAAFLKYMPTNVG